MISRRVQSKPSVIPQQPATGGSPGDFRHPHPRVYGAKNTARGAWEGPKGFTSFRGKVPSSEGPEGGRRPSVNSPPSPRCQRIRPSGCFCLLLPASGRQAAGASRSPEHVQGGLAESPARARTAARVHAKEEEDEAIRRRGSCTAERERACTRVYESVRECTTVYESAESIARHTSWGCSRRGKSELKLQRFGTFEWYFILLILE